METITTFFKNQIIDGESTAYLWSGNILNILIEGTFDSCNVIMQVKIADSFVDCLTFTKAGYAIVENLIAGVQMRFKVTDAGASTDITCTVIKA